MLFRSGIGTAEELAETTGFKLHFAAALGLTVLCAHLRVPVRPRCPALADGGPPRLFLLLLPRARARPRANAIAARAGARLERSSVRHRPRGVLH